MTAFAVGLCIVNAVLWIRVSPAMAVVWILAGAACLQMTKWSRGN